MTANQVLNCVPKTGSTESAYEIWHSRKPDLNKFLKFGAEVHVMLPIKKKLADKSVKGIFLGYEPNTKGYRVLNTENNNVMISQNNRIVTMKQPQK